MTTQSLPALGLRENAGQFALLVAVNALVGGMVGQERTVLPLLADATSSGSPASPALTFLVAFGADEGGRQPRRRRAGRPLSAASRSSSPAGSSGCRSRCSSSGRPTGAGSSLANVLLGINQGLTWSTTVIMKIDLVGPGPARPGDGPQRGGGLRRGRRHRLRDRAHRRAPRACARRRSCSGWPYAGLGLGAVGAVRPRDPRPRRPRGSRPAATATRRGGLARAVVVARRASREPALSAASPGRVSSTTSTTAWPGACCRSYYAAAGLSHRRDRRARRDLPGGLGRSARSATGALSDRVGRKRLIVARDAPPGGARSP